MKRMMLCVEANRIDLVEYLGKLGVQPQKIRGADYWYLSPFRAEKTPSFKVNRKLNLWYDHGPGKGGNLVDFGIQFYRCSVPELLHKLEEKKEWNVSFQPPLTLTQSALNREEKKLQITSVRPLSQPRFFRYLEQRKIDVAIARTYLNEVGFELSGKSFTALGFRNNRGGFELRNEYFKGSSAPKEVTLMDQDSEDLAVFEGCFSFLSYLCILQSKPTESSVAVPQNDTNFLVLNSLSFFEKSRSLMERHTHVFLYLDRDAAGLKATGQALGWSRKYQDRSALYEGYKDLNDYLVQRQQRELRQSLRRRGLL